MAFIGLLFVAAAMGQVAVDRIDGQPVVGDWVAIDETTLSIQYAGKTEQYPLATVVKLQRTSDAARSLTAVRVGLADGSELRVRQLQLQGKTAELQLIGGDAKAAELKLPIDQVASIRFRPPVAQAINEQWEQKLGADKPADTLVVRAGDDRLDEIAGTVLAISRDAVTFDLGGQQVDAPLDRLEGIVFRANDSPSTKARARVTDSSGSVWAAATITGRGASLQIETASGIQRELAIDQIYQLEFRGNMRILRAADAAETGFVAAVGGLLDPEFSKTLFGPRDVPEGIAMTAGSDLAIRLTDEDHWFETIVEADKRSFSGGQFQLQIDLDDVQVMDKTLTAAELPEAIRLDVSGKRRMRIHLKAGPDSSTGDSILFRKPRLRK